MKQQDIFDTVAKHLFTQGQQSIVNGICQYRDENDHSCAVGCLIPDSIYETKFEGQPINWLLAECDLLRDTLGGENDVLLMSLQSLHDQRSNDCDPWLTTLDMQIALADVASIHGLSAAILTDLKFVDR